MSSDVLGKRFAEALVAKDREALLALLDPHVDFRGLTPGRPWEAADAAEVVDDIILGRWFDPDDHIERLLHVGTGSMGDREHLAYRLQVRTGDARFLVEQQAYYATDGDRITWLRVLCSGYRPVDTGRP
ncbi:hypothetical protein [Streptodolium elevatio]